MSKPPKFTPSSAGFMLPGGVVATNQSNCLRNILLVRNNVRTPFPPKLGEMGEKFEELCGEYLANNIERPDTLLREEVLKKEVLGVPDSQFSGRQDFTYTNDQDRLVIVECKSTTSTRTRLECIRKRQPKHYHVAQLVSYMVHRNCTHGQLMYGYFEIDPDTDEIWCPHAIRDMNTKDSNFAVLEVDLSQDGKIWIDGKLFTYTVVDLLRHMNAVCAIQNPKIVADRPIDYDKEYSGACHYCPFKRVCDKYDGEKALGIPRTPDSFIEECAKVVETLTPHELKFFKPKRRRK